MQKQQHRRLLLRIIAIIIGLSTFACALHAETIPLYVTSNSSIDKGSIIVDSATQTEDDPGSSTVDPLDPNLGTAELTDNTLVVHEYMEGNVQIAIYNYTTQQDLLATRFDEVIEITLIEKGLYIIRMYHPEIGYVKGSFWFPYNSPTKVFNQGNLFILYHDNVYSPSGIKIK